MTNKTTVTKAGNENTIRQIADAIRSSANGIVGNFDDAAIAKKNAGIALDKAYESRTDSVVAFAKAAHAGNWTEGEIFEACAAVNDAYAKTKNDKSSLKTLANYLSELRAAGAPIVRPHVENLAKLCATVWETEVMMASVPGEDVDTPCKTAFKRLHTMTMAAFTLAKGSANVKGGAKGILLQNGEDVITWALSRDPALDMAKLAKRLKSLGEDIASEAARFPSLSALQDAADALGEVTEEKLTKARVSTQTFSFGIPTPGVGKEAETTHAAKLEAEEQAWAETEAKRAEAEITEAPAEEKPADLADELDGLYELTTEHRAAA